MHGPGYAPPPPHRPSPGALITLRVLFVVLAVLSCGFLAWASMLRLAVVTRRRIDWILFTASVAHVALCFLILITDPGEEEFTTWRGDVGMSLLLTGMLVTVAYYLYADIRHFSRPALAPYGNVHAHTHPHTATTLFGRQQAGYGYPAPQPQAPQPQAPQPQPQAPQPQPQPPYAPAPPAQPPVQPRSQPQSQRPAPARIDQVRAELDELSDYLRKHEGDR
ncbi:hypothetical protein [Streptomyces poonensis]|uniref:Integral membrane protein n=1 Tax=Streptomyces poonensis TaxID=68255 RepID=A0A918UKB7_9ACTN|nr:hypothetical protein [Streptomyces poonensis]GGZ16559.1 hypothetical protein GCM10010365_40730 [Streptomyces poonensis]GLJ92529.1 hypothetical protein GCM10017589_51380 [Streptomyces poonensis]